MTSFEKRCRNFEKRRLPNPAVAVHPSRGGWADAVPEAEALMTKASCKGCGKEIYWGKNPEGKMVPLDPKAPVYGLVKLQGVTQLVRTSLAMVSHFATCPKENDFSASRKA